MSAVAASPTDELSKPTGARVIPCFEQGPVDIPLVDVLDQHGRLNLNPEIENEDYFAVTLKKGSLTLRARGFVGFVPLNEQIVVYVQPRVPISNLARIIEISGQPTTVLSSMRGYQMGASLTDSLLDIYAQALLGHLETITQSGMWRDYAWREARSSFPHGRVSVHRTMQELGSRGIRHQAQISWFERTPDMPANQCLKYAVWLLAQRYARLHPGRGPSRTLWQRLNASYPMFDGVEFDQGQRFMDDAHVRGQKPLPTLRAYYRAALDLAIAIIEERGVLIDTEGSAIELPSLVVNMNYVFEGYVRNILTQYARSEEWGVLVYDGKLEGKKTLFDDASDPSATPDVVFELPDKTTPLVFEVKNVPGPDKPKRDAINQAVTYALRYRCEQVVLVTPCDQRQTSRLRRLGKIDQVVVYHYRVNLGSDDLRVEELSFARAIAGLV